ncbi:hypothetical protein GQ55_1G436400 [Panicum hallii var. hallii]|uniref:Uncharacterized protein n=1 Tax=Panicum hallii var. hallii TaxID=1504633 RepID=A0A2T7FDT0_9POAL|nr:hypothetical protein GQ55_1G436400 [Panicum hallii var. hallii]
MTPCGRAELQRPAKARRTRCTLRGRAAWTRRGPALRRPPRPRSLRQGASSRRPRCPLLAARAAHSRGPRRLSPAPAACSCCALSFPHDPLNDNQEDVRR